jgi:hypothetical protein
VLLDAISAIGGLYTATYGVLAMIKHRLTKSETIGIMTQRLFLTKKEAVKDAHQIDRQ